MNNNNCCCRLYQAFTECVSTKCKIVTIIITFLILVIIGLIITILILNLRVENGGAPLHKILIDRAIKKKKRYNG